MNHQGDDPTVDQKNKQGNGKKADECDRTKEQSLQDDHNSSFSILHFFSACSHLSILSIFSVFPSLTTFINAVKTNKT